MKIEYEEKAPFGWFGKLIAIGTPVLVIVVLFLFTTLPIPITALILQGVVSIIVILAMWVYYTTRFGITNKTVYAKQGPFKYEIEFKNITKTYVKRAPWWYGLGVRMVFWGRRDLGFITRYNKSVVVEKKSGLFNKVWFSVQDPEDFLKKLNKARK